MKGRCVRLFRGDPSRSKVYYEDPLEPALRFADEGARLIHVVDLDAALELGENTQVVLKLIRELPAAVQVGGGIRSREKAHLMLESGAYRVVVGTAVVTDPKWVKELVDSFGPQRVGAALDVKDGSIAIRGWKEKSQMTYNELAENIRSIGVGMVVATFTNVDGTLSGLPVQQVQEVVQVVRLPTIVAGGIGSLDHLKQLSKLPIHGVILGTALYEKRFTFKEAMEALRDAD